jgi:hypothetical protein
MIKGTVVDAKTGEPMLGATATLHETGKRQFVQLDGVFTFRNLDPGTYEVEVSYANYTTYHQQVVVKNGATAEMKISLQPSLVELSEVTITAGGVGSDKGARNREKSSDQMVNIVSAKTIQLLPDITVANVMQRVSGVTIEKNSSGEARYPIIRGMEKRYINTLVNGIKIPSPDNKSRFIPLDLFPAELLERLEVSKTLTPSMEGDAIGGTINLVMKDAPATKIFQVNVSMGYNNIFRSQDYLQFDNGLISKSSPAEKNNKVTWQHPSDFPTSNLNYTKRSGPINTAAGITIGERFGKDDKFGLLFSGTYQDILLVRSRLSFCPTPNPAWIIFHNSSIYTTGSTQQKTNALG